jgi:streptomycin 6-kinase
LGALRHGGDGRAVDPFGALGEPAFDAGTRLTNPVSLLPYHRDLCSIEERRVALPAERLAKERARIAVWGYVVSVLKMAWDIEDGTDEGRQWRSGADWVAAMTR